MSIYKLDLDQETEKSQQRGDRMKKTIQLPQQLPSSRLIPKQPDTPIYTKDAWKQMFGTFLHDINLKKNKSDKKEEGMDHLSDPLVYETPILVQQRNKDLKLHLYKYLDGNMSAIQLLNKMNFPTQVKRQEQVQVKEQVIKKGFINKFHKFKKDTTLGVKKDTVIENSSDNISMFNEQQHIKEQQMRLIKQRRYTEAGKMKDSVKTSVNSKLQVLKDLIKNRVALRQTVNLEEREENVHNIHFIKTFFDITHDYNQKLNRDKEQLNEDYAHFHKKLPCQKKLRQILVSYDNVGPVIKHQNSTEEVFNTITSPGVLKNIMMQHSKDFIQELSCAKDEEYRQALTEVRKLLENQNIQFQSTLRKSITRLDESPNHKRTTHKTLNSSPFSKCRSNIKTNQSPLNKQQRQPINRDPKQQFYFYTRRAKQDTSAKNAKGIITQYDVKLYDYIHNRKIHTNNPKIQSLSKKFRQMVETEEESKANLKLELQLNQRRFLKDQMKPKRKFLSRVRSEPTVDDIQTDSDDASLQSIYEVNLDNLYNQSAQLAKKLNERNDGGFAKRLKQLMRLEEVNNACIDTNVCKLSKQHL